MNHETLSHPIEPSANALTPHYGICIKSAQEQVVYQNSKCVEICGDQTSNTCRNGCMRLFARHPKYPVLSEGVQMFPNEVLHERSCDVLILNDGTTVTTLLYPLEKKHERTLALLKQYKLSPREMELMNYVIRGESNTSISKKLQLSKSTVKTHINNIYKKLPADLSKELQRRTGARASTSPDIKPPVDPCPASA